MYTRFLIVLGLALNVALALSWLHVDGAGAVRGTGIRQEITISAAVSMCEVLKEIAVEFERIHPDTRVLFNFGASGALAHQIEQGADADVFVSASINQMKLLEARHLVVASDVKTVAGNRLVIIVPDNADASRTTRAASATGSPAITSLHSLRQATKIAIGDPDLVPAGQYARDVLRHEGLYEQLLREHRIVFAESVRQVLIYVEGANVDAGFVYATDALSGKNIRVCLQLPFDTRTIIYPAAVLKESKHRVQADCFVQFLLGPTSQIKLQRKGFVVSL